MAHNLSNVIGSMIRSSKFLTLESATYARPAIFSVVPKSIQALLNVRPCDLWMVIDHASLNGNCCHSYADPKVSELLVTGTIGTHCGESVNMLGPM